MKLILRTNGEDVETEVERLGSGYRVRIGGQWINADVVSANNFLKSLRLDDGRQFLLAHQSEGNRHLITFGDHSVSVDVYDPLSLKRRHGGDDEGHGGTIRALMPGRVVRLLVEEGATVTKGMGLLILEAMKMENEIAAPKDGVVSGIHVTAGQTVEGGADLLTLE